MPDEAARQAGEADVSRLAELARAAIDEMASQRGGAVFAAREARAEPVASSLSGDLADPDAVVVAGTLDGVVVGYAAGRVETLRDGSRLGVISDLYVEPEAREVGVGEAMMGFVVEHFRSSGCAAVDAMVLPGQRSSKNFFEAAGFTARLLVVHHRLADPES